MNLSQKVLKILLLIVIIGFSIAFYLQDQKRDENTAHAWKVNRYNLERFENIAKYNKRMNSTNWMKMKDSISQQMDTLMILRFRKEVDSLDAQETKVRSTK